MSQLRGSGNRRREVSFFKRWCRSCFIFKARASRCI